MHSFVLEKNAALNQEDRINLVIKSKGQLVETMTDHFEKVKVFKHSISTWLKLLRAKKLNPVLALIQAAQNRSWSIKGETHPIKARASCLKGKDSTRT